MAHNLTHTKLQSLTPADKPYKVTDGGGLFLEVLPSGAMVWRYQYLLNGKREKVTIGPYREAGGTKSRIIVDLAKARDQHAVYKRLVLAGESPARSKQAIKRAAKADAERAATFRDLAERWFNEEVSQKSAGWQRSVRGWFNLDIFPSLGKRDPREIEEFHIQQLVESVEKRGAPASANKVRAICDHIFAYARRKKEVTSNPVRDIERITYRSKSHRPLSVQEIQPFLTALDADGGREINKIAIRLLMLTFVRKDELRLAKWHEIDLENKIWRIPAHRMKMEEDHTIYLSRQAVDLFRQLQDMSRGSDYVLPSLSTNSRPIGHTTINNMIDRLEIKGARFVPHGFRTTASTLLNEKGFRGEVIERALAHAERNRVRAVYNRAQYATERIEIMNWWGDYLEAIEKGSNVIPVNFKTVA